MVQSVVGERSVAKQREILAAASRLFRQRGLHATGMRAIAAEAGMHAGNLYYYFESKQELLAFCQQRTLAQLLAAAESIRDASRPPDAQLAELIVRHVVLLNEETPGSLAHLEVEALEPRWRRRLGADRDRYERVFRELIEAGISAGLFRPVDTKVAALAILGALNWTVKWFRPEGSRSAREIGAEFARLLLGGLATRDPLPPGRPSPSAETPQ